MLSNAIYNVPKRKNRVVRWRRLIGVVASALLSLCAPLVYAAPWHDVLEKPVLVGEGAFRWLGIRLYTAQLWSSALPFSDDKPFALQLTYDFSIERQKFVDTSIDEIRRMRGQEVEARLTGWREALQRLMVDVKAGDQLTGLWLPGRGARFYHGERFIAETQDIDLARHFFAIWLSEGSRDQRLRSKLLGNAS